MTTMTPESLALRVAQQCHGDQTDRFGITLIDHVQAVAARVDDPVLRAIALLHETIEETPTTAEDLAAAGVDERVLAAVVALSQGPDEPDEENWTRIAANPDALAVKYADLDEHHTPDKLARLDADEREAVEARLQRARDFLAGASAN